MNQNESKRFVYEMDNLKANGETENQNKGKIINNKENKNKKENQLEYHNIHYTTVEKFEKKNCEEEEDKGNFFAIQASYPKYRLDEE